MSESKKELLIVLGIIFSALLISVCIIISNGSNHEQFKKELVEYEKTRIVFGNYVKLTKLDCRDIKKLYSKKDLKEIPDIELYGTTCFETYSDFYLKSSLIRYKQVMYQVILEWDGGRITEIKPNIPYCVIATDKAEFPVAEACERIP